MKKPRTKGRPATPEEIAASLAAFSLFDEDIQEEKSMSVENTKTRPYQDILEQRADFHHGIPLQFTTGEDCEEGHILVQLRFRNGMLYSTLPIPENVALVFAEKLIHAVALTLDDDFTLGEDRLERAVQQNFEPLLAASGLDGRIEMDAGADQGPTFSP